MYVLEWLCPGTDLNKGQVEILMQLVACMRDMRVTAALVVYNWIQRRTQPLQRQKTFGFEYQGTRDSS